MTYPATPGTRRRARTAWMAALIFGLAGAMQARGTPPPTSAAFAAEIDGLWNFAEPAASERRFKDVLAAWPTDSPQALEIRTQIARAQGLQRHFVQAHVTLDSIERQLDGMPSHVRVRYLLERGRAFNSAGLADKAVPFFRSALDLAQCDANDFYAIDAAHMLGIAAPQAERLDWNLRAIAMTEHTPDVRSKRWLASLYNNVGWTYMDAGEPGRALAYFRKAVPAWEARGDAADVRTARWAVARALRATGELDDAERIQHALLDEHIRVGTVDGYVFEELAELRWARGDRATARTWFRKAWEALKDDPALRSGEPQRLARLAELGGIGGAAASSGR